MAALEERLKAIVVVGVKVEVARRSKSLPVGATITPGVVVARIACTGRSHAAPSGLASASLSSSMICAPDHELSGVRLGGGLPLDRHFLVGGVWNSVSCSCFCSFAMVAS